MDNFSTSKLESLEHHKAILENKKAYYKFEFQKLKTIVRELEAHPELIPGDQPVTRVWNNLIKIHTEMEMIKGFIRELEVLR